MAKVWNEKLSNLSEKLDDLSKKAAEAANDAKTYHELLQDVIDEKIAPRRAMLPLCRKMHGLPEKSIRARSAARSSKSG